MSPNSLCSFLKSAISQLSLTLFNISFLHSLSKHLLLTYLYCTRHYSMYCSINVYKIKEHQIIQGSKFIKYQNFTVFISYQTSEYNTIFKI